MRYENNYSELAGSSNYSDLIFFLSTTTKTEREGGGLSQRGYKWFQIMMIGTLAQSGRGGMNIENSHFLN